MYSLIERGKLNGLNQRYLADVLTRIETSQ